MSFVQQWAEHTAGGPAPIAVHIGDLYRVHHAHGQPSEVFILSETHYLYREQTIVPWEAPKQMRKSLGSFLDILHNLGYQLVERGLRVPPKTSGHH